MNQYQLVFNGTVSDGHNLVEVKRNLASLFKTDKTKIEQLFASLPIVLKKNVDYDAAIKYQQALRRVGAVCQVEETVANIKAPVIEKAAPPPPLLHNPSASAVEVENARHSDSAPTKESQKEGIKGVGDILSGLVLIGIGFLFGGSIFMGDATWLDYLFDCLGLFWIGRGVYKMVT
jgi:hypothetical protein